MIVLTLSPTNHGGWQNGRCEAYLDACRIKAQDELRRLAKTPVAPFTPKARA
jgi:hypothetical protein